MLNAILTIATTEFTAAARLWWIRLFVVAFTAMTVAMAWIVAGNSPSASTETFARLTVALLPLVLTLVPLSGLLVGVSSMPDDAGGTDLLLVLPVTETEVVLGRWLGQAGALAVAIGVGFGLGGCLSWAAFHPADPMRFFVLVTACLVLALSFLSIATLVSAWCSKRGAAVGVAVFIWFVAVIFYDATALAAAIWLAGSSGTHVLFVSVFGNVVDLVRVATLTLAGTPHILGAAGESWIRGLGGAQTAAIVSIAVLACWMTIPLVIAVRASAFRER